MKILQTHSTEMGKTVRQQMTEKHGIPFVQIKAARPLETREFSFTRPHISLFSYVRPSNGQTLYLVEAEFYGPPDAQWWTSWVIDALPTDEQMALIVAYDLQTGTIVSSDLEASSET